MPETKFTPGPWEVGGPGDDFTTTEICTVFGVSRRPTEDGLGQGWVYVTGHKPSYDVRSSEKTSNAHLIAAAPDLYEALKRITDCYGVGWKDAAKFCEAVEDFMNEGRAALARARGDAA